MPAAVAPDPLELGTAALEELALEIAWLQACGVTVVADGRIRPPDGRPATPVRLHLVAPGARPPACGALEDWIRLPVDPGELRSRADRLVARAAWQGPSPVVVDGDGVVRVGAQLTIVGPQEAMLLRRLAAPAGRLVARHELVEAVWGEDVPSDPRALDNRVKALRRHLVGLPVRIHTVRGRGFLLEVSAVG